MISADDTSLHMYDRQEVSNEVRNDLWRPNTESVEGNDEESLRRAAADTFHSMDSKPPFYIVLLSF